MKTDDFTILQAAGLNYFEMVLQVRKLVRQAKAARVGGQSPPNPPAAQKESMCAIVKRSDVTRYRQARVSIYCSEHRATVACGH